MRVKKEAIIFLIFFLVGILSRALFASKDFTHMDGVLYAIGTFKYDIKDYTPPSSTYFLYVMSGKLLNIFTHDPHTSLMLLSIFYSGLIAGTIYYFGTLLGGRTTGIVCGILFLTSPLFWYKGISIFAYLNSGFFILLTALLGYKLVLKKENKIIFWFSVCLGILLGIRIQESIVILPLYLFVLFKLGRKEALFSITVFLITCTLWVMPLIFMSGGLDAYLSVMRMRSSYLVEDSIFGGSFISKINNHLIRMAQYFEWAYFLGIVPLVYYIGRFFYLPNLVNEKKTQFFAVWMLPTIIYNIFIQFGEIGHGMSWGLGIFLILGESIVVFCEDISQTLRHRYWKRATYAFVLIPIISVNFFMFFFNFNKNGADFYSFERYRQFNYMDVLKNNRFLMSKINFIKNNFKPENLIIISSSTFGCQVKYRLPDAVIIQVNILHKKDNFGLQLFDGFKRLYYKNKKDFIIPKDITKLIIFDDIFVPYIQNRENSIYYEVGNSNKLLVYDVTPGERIIFDYHSIRVE